MAITKKWLHNKYWDVTGTTAGIGTVRFELSEWVDDPIDNESFAPGSFSVELGHDAVPDGEFLVQLRINDDPNDNPNNTAWKVTETVDGKARTRTVQILSSNPKGDSSADPIELDDLAPVVASPVFGSYVPAALYDLLEARVDDLEAGGGGGPGGGNVATDTIWDVAGDLAVGSGSNTAARMARGAASTFLRVNSGGTALVWGAIVDADLPATIARDSETVLKTLVDAAGDLLVGTAADTVGRLAKGSALQVLRVNSAGTALEWATPAASGDISSADIDTIEVLTQAEYDGLASPDASTLYVISDAVEPSTFVRTFLNDATAAEARGTLDLDVSGKGWVNHGSTAGTARPSGYASVEWYGTVSPNNAITGDTWNDPTP